MVSLKNFYMPMNSIKEYKKLHISHCKKRKTKKRLLCIQGRIKK